MTKKDKAIQELCDSLGGDYKVQDIDLETCIYRDFGNGFDVEISGVYTTSQKKKATIYYGVWEKDIISRLSELQME